jgi:hypothetical protein
LSAMPMTTGRCTTSLRTRRAAHGRAACGS